MVLSLSNKVRNVIPRAYYCTDVIKFLTASHDDIYSTLVHNSLEFDFTGLQDLVWNSEIMILKKVLSVFRNGTIALEYTIPRMGERIDCVIIYGNYVFLLEFKVNEKEYPKVAQDQVTDYALDLHNFHEQSHAITLFPILVCTKAPDVHNVVAMRDRISSVICCNAETLLREMQNLMANVSAIGLVNPQKWINSIYKPTPTIIEAAQALYSGHDVKEISHKESADNDLETTTSCINRIIEESKQNHWKSICFVTGVPGAGKTLVGLNIANRRHLFKVGSEEHAVFLSGNGPLVDVLQEALTRDQSEKVKNYCRACAKKASRPDCNLCPMNLSKSNIRTETKSFIQKVYLFRDESLRFGHPAPIDKIAIFDEAQRAWDKKQLVKFMTEKRSQSNFDMTEPECLIEYLNRHRDWATIICLVGGGQEINTGEIGISGWFDALNEQFPDWKVFCSDKIVEPEYVGNSSVRELLANCDLHFCKELHLSVSMRSFRSEKVSAFVAALINADLPLAQDLYRCISEVDPETGNVRYPVVMTRNLALAKQWVRGISRGSERYGIVASSCAQRLRADGIIIGKDLKVENWFLNEKTDVNASYGLELAATEFEIQGLEIDYAVVAWGGDYRFTNGAFTYNNFRGTSWTHINDIENQKYLKNAYRVLLTRARQGLIIYVPCGSHDDATRDPAFYDGTYKYLQQVGIKEIK